MLPRLVFVTRYSPTSIDRGSPIRAYRLAEGLNRHFSTTLVTFAAGADGSLERREQERAIERLLPGADACLVPGGDLLSKKLHWNLHRRSSVQFGRLDTRAVPGALRALTPRITGAVFHFDDLAMALSATPAPGSVRVANTHNIEHRTLHQIARKQPLHTRALLELEARKISAEEHTVWKRFDVILACSDVDASVIRRGGAKRVIVCPNGADPVPRLPMKTLEPGQPFRLLFVGSADFWPYSMGLEWFVRHVMPALQEDGPTTLDVVGHPPERPVPHPLVSYVGRVPDVRPYYDASQAVVIPLFEGSGTRLKAVEAAAFGRPIVSTRLGMEGLPFETGTHYMGAETAAQFRAAVAELRRAAATGGSATDRLLAMARQRAETLFWPVITTELADSYRSLLER